MELRRILADQDGVISRRQVLACDRDDGFIEQRLRRKDWSRVHRGVYVDHTGQLSWGQRLWAALLFAAPAVACDESALHLHGVAAAGRADRLHVAIDPSRRVVAPSGVRMHHVDRLAETAHVDRLPPVMRIEPAVLRVASGAVDDAAAVALLGDACQSRRTTPARLVAGLDDLTRLRRRAFLQDLLHDVATGAYSALEHRYLTKVERPHGLPTGTRQRRVSVGRRPAYRDVEYLGGLLVLELDGRLGHETSWDRWADLERDIAGLISGSVTTRLGWGQVLQPCRAASAVGQLLVAVGWDGRPRTCGPGCAASRP